MKNRVNSKRENYLSFIINYHIILLIPMLIVAFSTFFVVRQHNLERVMTEVELKTESQSKYWDQEMSVILLQYNDCRYSKFTARHHMGWDSRLHIWISCRT